MRRALQSRVTSLRGGEWGLALRSRRGDVRGWGWHWCRGSGASAVHGGSLHSLELILHVVHYLPPHRLEAGRKVGRGWELQE